MTLLRLYFASVAGLAAAIIAIVLVAARRRSFRPFTTIELATASLLICLLHVAVTPWQIGLARLPGVDALVFSIPYTAVLLLGLRLVPKPGIATVLIFGEGLLGQMLGRGINPAWWPYYLWCAACVEGLLLLVGNSLRSLPAMLGVGVLRGALAYSYMYLILAPFLWRQYYDTWYVSLKVSMGMLGCVLGTLLAWRIAPAVEKASRHSSL
jgi:hypothetical protein